MKKKNVGLIILIAGLLLFGINAYAADGDLIVDGQLHVTGEVSVRSISPGCSDAGGLTTNTSCSTLKCSSDPNEYYDCTGDCVSGQPQQCNNVYVGKVFP